MLRRQEGLQRTKRAGSDRAGSAKEGGVCRDGICQERKDNSVGDGQGTTRGEKQTGREALGPRRAWEMKVSHGLAQFLFFIDVFYFIFMKIRSMQK